MKKVLLAALVVAALPTMAQQVKYSVSGKQFRHRQYGCGRGQVLVQRRSRQGRLDGCET